MAYAGLSIHAGAAWRMMPFGFAVAYRGKPSCSAVSPHDLPHWEAVYQQTQRWFKASVFKAIVDDLRALLRLATGRAEEPSAVIFDSRYPTINP